MRRGRGHLKRVFAGWRDATIVAASTPFVGSIFCNKTVIRDRGALNEIGNAGLGGLVYKAGGGYFGRARWEPRAARPVAACHGIPTASRLDIDTDQNVLGGVPRTDCRVVQIFRKWGFAWGGNFLVSDGMHFEWVNERREVMASDSARSG